MTIYWGVDFHARQQTICYCDSAGGEIRLAELDHERDDVRGFYSAFNGEVVLGVEASGYSTWFVELVEGLGHRVLVGDTAEIRRLARRRQKNDHRDADLILELLHKGDFPQVNRSAAHSLEVLRQLRYRHRLVRMRTMVKNSLHAIALGAGLSLQSKIGTAKSRQRLRALALPSGLATQRDEWLSLLDALDTKIATAEQWLTAAAAGNEQVMRLQTHPGIGLITSLALVHILEPVARFPAARKVVGYAGLDPVEHSSAERKRYGSISKEGCRFLRFLLVETAQKAVGGDQELRTFYYRLLQRKERAKARVAVARKVLTRSYIMLRDRIDYAEFLRRGVEARSARCVA